MVYNPRHRTTREPLPLRQAPQCGARTRSGNPCLSPVVRGKRRCRMHGGAKGSGAPFGERNGNYRHGRFTAGPSQTARTAAQRKGSNSFPRRAMPRLQPFRLPGQAARQLPDQSTTIRVESSSTGDPRLRGALPTRTSGGRSFDQLIGHAPKGGWGIIAICASMDFVPPN